MQMPEWVTPEIVAAEMARRELSRRGFNLEAYLKGKQEPREGSDDPLPAPEFYGEWLQALFPNPTHAPLAPHHHAFWRWLWSIELGVRPRPRAEAWPRGHAKSSSGQRGVVAVGARGRRKYVMYVMATQAQANKAVANIAALITKPSVASFYPALAQRAVSQYNNPLGWSKTIIRTASGFTVEAAGLDTSKRGANIEDQRPDMIVLDDLDEKDDSLEATKGKIETLTKDILPMGTPQCAVLYLQNLIIPTGIMTRLGIMAGAIESDVEPASFLMDIDFGGPIPAVEDIKTQSVQTDSGRIAIRITSGRATWAGMDIQACEDIIKNEGLLAFERERQNDARVNIKALLQPEVIERNRVMSVDDLEAIVVAVDPPAEGGGCGIVVKGMKTINGLKHTFRLEDASLEDVPPHVWGLKVLMVYQAWKANRVIGEVNQGGRMVEHVIRSISLYDWNGQLVSGANLTDAEKARATCVLDGRYVPFTAVRATVGKVTRAEPVANREQQGLLHSVGHHAALEKLWCYWTPGGKSPDPLDADVWSEYGLVPELGAELSDRQNIFV